MFRSSRLLLSKSVGQVSDGETSSSSAIRCQRDSAKVRSAVTSLRRKLRALRSAFRDLNRHEHAIDRLEGRLTEISVRLESEVDASALNSSKVKSIESALQSINTKVDRILAVVQVSSIDTVGYRSLLDEARSSPSYSRAFEESDPLVSVIVPTHRAPDAMWSRTIPSLLGQSYGNLEVLVAIDGNFNSIEHDVRARVDQLGDRRVRVLSCPPTPDGFPELAHLGVSDHSRFEWFSSGNGAYSYAVREAKGLWISPFSHDDELDLDAIKILHAAVVERRIEFCFSPIRKMEADGSVSLIFSNPPRPYQFGVQGSLLHAGLNFFTYEFRDAALDVPNDWGMVRSMMLAGVRMGHVTEPLSTYFPSQIHGSELKSTDADS